MQGHHLVRVAFLCGLLTQPVMAQAPSGLAGAALANPEFRWERRDTAGFRVYFLAGSYPAQHQDSLIARLEPAARNAERFINAAPLEQPIDLFFVESREQMTRLVGGRATGFAQPSARAVFLMTNPSWRAFERHEIMHVVVGQAWGRNAPNMDWLVEGLAQAADGRCGRFSNAEVVQALAARRGWIPLPAVLTQFRAQPDLRAYLQAAAFVEYLLPRVGPTALKEIWTKGVSPDTILSNRSLATHEAEWRATLDSRRLPNKAELDAIEAEGCGI